MSGDDDAAREQLQSIGLQSPFLEWKLMLRGLIAFAANDDATVSSAVPQAEAAIWRRLDHAGQCLRLRTATAKLATDGIFVMFPARSRAIVAFEPLIISNSFAEL